MTKKTLNDFKWNYFRPKSEKLKLPKDEGKLIGEFEAIAGEIVKVVKFVTKHGGQHLTKNCLPNNYARRLIYQLIVHCAEFCPTGEYEEKMKTIFISKYSSVSPKTKSAASKNTFFLCYLVILGNDVRIGGKKRPLVGGKKRPLVGSTERSRAARLLQQAFNAKVPQKYLVGYILQNSNLNNSSQLLTGKI